MVATFKYVGLEIDTNTMVGTHCADPIDLDVHYNWHFQIRGIPLDLDARYVGWLKGPSGAFWFNPDGSSERWDDKCICNDIGRWPLHTVQTREVDPDAPEGFSLRFDLYAAPWLANPPQGVTPTVPIPGTVYSVELFDDPAEPPGCNRIVKQTITLTIPAHYTYYRQAAARYAAVISRKNLGNFDDFPFGTFQPPLPPVAPNVGGAFCFNYQGYLTHVTGQATGSSTFISEAVYAGGMPMTVGSEGAGTCDVDIDEGSWRVCPDVGCNGVGNCATISWKSHVGLKGLYENDRGATNVGSIQSNDLVQYMNFSEGAEFFDDAGRTFLYNQFKQGGPLADVDTGDYVFLDLQSDINHGLLIVGWGPAEDGYKVLNGLDSNRVSLFTPFRDRNADQIPYVADFCYGIEGQKFGWLQDPRPRPFYCSAATITRDLVAPYSQI